MCHVRKIHRIGDALYGFAGDGMLSLLMVEWLDTNRNRPGLYKLIPEAYRDEVEILELSPSGLALWNGWGVRMPILDACYAIGSGAMAALTALRSTATPEQAILRAMELDECSGLIGEPELRYLDEPQPKRPARKRTKTPGWRKALGDD